MVLGTKRFSKSPEIGILQAGAIMADMQTTEQPVHNPSTFESVWAVLDRLAESQNELRESQKETARQMKETDKQIGRLGRRFGDVIEYMVAPNLRQKFRELGLNFPSANMNSDVADFDNDIFFEIDVMLDV